jgi:serine/threonine-protein kinase RsbW
MAEPLGAEDATPFDEVRLALPASPEFLRLARVTATGLASRLGFTFDDVEDLRLAIDEMCFTLIGPKGRAGNIELVYRILEHALEVAGTIEAAEITAPELSEWSDQILNALVDEHEVWGDERRSGFRLLKRRDSD